MRDLYIDFDGVILDTLNSSYKMLEENGIDKKNYEEASIFFRNLDWKDVMDQAEMIHDSMSCIQKIIDSKKFRVSILTHVLKLEEIIAKHEFIRKYCKEINIICVPKQISKADMVDPRGAILIDDFADNLRKWQEAGGIAVRFSLKKNGKGFPVIDYLDQILDLEI